MHRLRIEPLIGVRPITGDGARRDRRHSQIGVATTIEERAYRVAPTGTPAGVEDVRVQCGEPLRADLTTLIPGEVRLRTRIRAIGTVDPVADVHEEMADQLSQGCLLAEESGRW